MLFPDKTPEDQKYWQQRAAQAEDKNNSLKVVTLIIMAVCISLTMIFGLMLVGQGNRFDAYQEKKVNYESHTVVDFNRSAMKTVSETRSELKVPGGLERWETIDDKALLASLQGCALGLYEYDEFSPDQCTTALPDNLTLKVDSIRFKSGLPTEPDSGLPTQDEFKKRLMTEQKSKTEAAPPDEERTDAPYITRGKPHVFEETAEYQYVYAVGGDGGDWVVYIFSAHTPAE